MRILDLLKKDIRIFGKSKSAIILSYLVPMVITLIFGAIFGGFGEDDGGINGIKVLVTDNDKTGFSKNFIENVDALEEITVYRKYVVSDDVHMPFTQEKMDEYIIKGNYPVGILIEKGFEEKVKNKQPLALKIHYDPKYPIEHGIVVGMMQKLIPTKYPQLMMNGLWNSSEEYLGEQDNENFKSNMMDVVKQYFPEAKEISLDSLMVMSDVKTEASEGGEGQSSMFDKLMDIESVELLGKKVKNKMFAQYVAGMAIMFLLFAVSSTASSLLEEKKNGTIKRLLIAPMNGSDILYSKVLFCSLLGISQLIVLFIFGWLVFGLDIFYDVPALLVMMIVTALACSSLGIFLATICRNQQQVGSLSTLIVLGMSALGGSMVPTFVMPKFVQNIGKFTLNHWAMKGFTDIFWRGMHLNDLYLPIVILSSISIVLLFISKLLFDRRFFE